MKKRILSFLLALLMVVSIFPAPAYATDSTDVTITPTETTETSCPTCGTVGCTSEHLNWCSDCQKDNCGQNHCDTCGAIDCTTEHKICDKCGTLDCTADHTNWCADCKVDNCGQNHCPTCRAIDCTKEHKPCKTCAVIDCTADHTNWCEICKFDNCGKDHNATEPTEPATEPVAPINEGSSKETHPMVGKYVKLTNGGTPWGYVTDPNWSNVIVTAYPAFMEVSDVLERNGVTYYRLKAAPNYVWSSSNAYPNDTVYLESTKLTVVTRCSCGQYDCGVDHSQPENPCDCGCETCTGAEDCECFCGECDFCQKSGFDGENDEFVDSELEETDGEVTVQIRGYLPTGAKLQMNAIAAPNVEFEGEGKVYAYDLSLEWDGEKIQPGAPVKVTFENVTLYPDGVVCVYHVLDTVAAIQSRLGASNVGAIPSTEFGLSGSAAEQAALTATGEAGVVYVEYFSSEDGTVSLGAGTVTITVNSFSPYYMVSGDTRQGSIDSEIITVNDGADYKIYVAPGTTIRFYRSDGTYNYWKLSINAGDYGIGAKTGTASSPNKKNIGTGWTGSAIDINGYEYATITIPANLGSLTFTLESCQGAGTTRKDIGKVTIAVRSVSEVVSGALVSTTYPVFLACLQDSTVIPGEPGVTSAGFYFLNSSYAPQGGFPHFAPSGNGVIASNIGSHPNFKASADGTNTMGLVDSTGKTTKAAASGINWDSALRGIVNAGSSVKASDGVTVTSANVEYYEMLPYVIKLQTATSLGWHIDCMVVPKNTATLSYSLNLPGGNTVSGIALPAGVNKPTPFSVTVGAVAVNGTNLSVGSKVTTTDGRQFTFDGWYANASGTGNRVEIGSNLQITGNTVLYAKWSGGGYTIGTLVVGKTVTTAANSYDPDPNQQFTFSISGLSGSYSYKIYDATTYSEISSGTMSNTFTLLANQAIYISNVPVGTYRITETNIPTHYEANPSYYDATIAGGVENSFVFNNIYENLKTYSVSGSIDDGGNVTNSNQTVTHGSSSAAMTFTPKTGYEISSITVQKGTAKETVTVTEARKAGYTYAAQNNVTGPITVTVTTVLKKYPVTGSIDEGCEVTNGDQMVSHGNNSTAMVFTPKTGYEISSITVKKGTDEETVTVTEEYKAGYTYEAQKNVTGPITVTVTTSPVEETVTISYEIKTKFFPAEGEKTASLTVSSEEIQVNQGEPEGSTIHDFGENFEFVGWYDNAELNGDPIGTEVNFVPAKPADGVWKDATYYAKINRKIAHIYYEIDGITMPEGKKYYLLDLDHETQFQGGFGCLQGSNLLIKEYDYVNLPWEFLGWYDAAGNLVYDEQVEIAPGVTIPHFNVTPDCTRPNGWPAESYYYARFKEKEVTFNYIPVGPEGATNFATLSTETQTVSVFADNVASTATAAPAYKFVGWYADPECTELITTDETYRPAKNAKTTMVISGTNELHELEHYDSNSSPYTYYAKFEYNLTSLTIQKSGASTSDANQSFIFNIKGNGVDMDVVVHGNGSVTIDGLTVGAEYTITEKTDWSWRYVPGNNGRKVTLGLDDTITFTNNRSETKWLNGAAWCDNRFTRTN